METNQDQSGAGFEPLAPGAAQLLASSFDISVEEVVLDARHLVAWQGSNDDLMGWLEERHGFRAGTAAKYLRDLRVSMRVGPGHP